MSRAIRRQQAQSGSQGDGSGGGGRRGGGGGRMRPFGPRGPGPNRGAQPHARKRRIGVPTWISEIWSELRKVTWPTRDETAYLTMVVIIVAVVVGIALGVIDVFFNELVDRLLFD